MFSTSEISRIEIEGAGEEPGDERATRAIARESQRGARQHGRGRRHIDGEHARERQANPQSSDAKNTSEHAVSPSAKNRANQLSNLSQGCSVEGADWCVGR